MDEDRSAGVGDGVQQRQRFVGLLWRGEAVGGKADAGSARRNGLPGELGLAFAGEGLRGRRPPAELGWQSRSCFLPGGDGGEGVAGRERLEADGARERHEGPIDGQAASTLVGIVIPRIDIEGWAPPGARCASGRPASGPSEARYAALEREERPRARGADGRRRSASRGHCSALSIKLVGNRGLRAEVSLRARTIPRVAGIEPATFGYEPGVIADGWAQESRWNQRPATEPSCSPANASLHRSLNVTARSFDPPTTAAVSRSST